MTITADIATSYATAALTDAYGVGGFVILGTAPGAIEGFDVTFHVTGYSQPDTMNVWLCHGEIRGEW